MKILHYQCKDFHECEKNLNNECIGCKVLEDFEDAELFSILTTEDDDDEDIS